MLGRYYYAKQDFDRFLVSMVYNCAALEYKFNPWSMPVDIKSNNCNIILGGWGRPL